MTKHDYLSLIAMISMRCLKDDTQTRKKKYVYVLPPDDNPPNPKPAADEKV